MYTVDWYAKWIWLLGILKHSPKLQNLVIHVRLIFIKNFLGNSFFGELFHITLIKMYFVLKKKCDRILRI